jgi:Flp pilus assembly protein TadG
VKTSRSQQRGAVIAETVIGVFIFLAFIGFIFDFGMILHRHSLLVDMTLKTAQQATRDPLAAESEATLITRAEDIFNQQVARIASGGASKIKVTVEYLCEQQALRVISEWQVTCAFCILGGFTKTVNAKAYGIIESPGPELTCLGSDT